MRVPVDACVDPRVVEGLPGHEVKTAVDLGWHRLKDHHLVRLLQDRFDVLVTIDRGFEHQQNLKALRFGLVIVHVAKNKVEFYRPLFGQIQTAVAQVKPGEVLHVYGLPSDQA
jgi:hypothetical protein